MHWILREHMYSHALLMVCGSFPIRCIVVEQTVITCSMHVPGFDLCILFLCSPSGLGLVLYSISLRALILAWGPGVCAAVLRGLYLVCLSLNKKDLI